MNYGVPITNRFNTRSDYGNVEGNRRNRFLLTAIEQLPFGHGRAYLNGGGVKDILLGGWDLNTVTLIESGPFLTPSISPGADQSNTGVAARGAFLRPDQVSNDFAKAAAAPLTSTSTLPAHTRQRRTLRQCRRRYPPGPRHQDRKPRHRPSSSRLRRRHTSASKAPSPTSSTTPTSRLRSRRSITRPWTTHHGNHGRKRRQPHRPVRPPVRLLNQNPCRREVHSVYRGLPLFLTQS